LMKIDGVDHSTVKVKVWVATDGDRRYQKYSTPVPVAQPRG
jgi:hypothetical protein